MTPEEAAAMFVERYGSRDGETIGEWAKRLDVHPADCVLAFFGRGALAERFALEIAEPMGES